ncbi:DUF3598 family protein [Calothrix sp. UHCC 0171]|uniref:DUF3598 family protein n=1 Tax=Calothrix sp. UHCC 0171 TaxID=3110245 RepID=UPI002B214A99|nr:DUF3598 family protein [Calothrix sp. UHCC 0171]MEA5571550.1 DUF3598 family protein [Calothrix sp. UHCC 0171]
MLSQWESFLQNLGIWVGSFTQFSPTGEELENIPSRLHLEGLNNNQSARLTLQRQGGQDLVLELSTLSRSLLFFENGAFSQGTIQFSPFSEFGAEFGLIYHNRRLRLVQLFDTNNNLRKLTLIREYREGTQLNERPRLTIDALLGEWEGEAITIYPDWREPSNFPTKMQLAMDSGGRLVQNTSFGDNPTLTSSATINGSILNFDQNPQNPIQVLMLPDAASATFPIKAQLNQPLFLEIGWLLEPDLRQRMIRSYNDKGEWVSLTLVTERKVN